MKKTVLTFKNQYFPIDLSLYQHQFRFFIRVQLYGEVEVKIVVRGGMNQERITAVLPSTTLNSSTLVKNIIWFETLTQ